MKVRIAKRQDDGRSFTYGVVLPDGFYRVMELSRFNGDIIAGFEQRGYEVTEMDDEDGTLPGLYFAEADQRVEDNSALAYVDPEAPDRRLIPRKAEEMDQAKWIGMPKDERRRRKIGQTPRGSVAHEEIGARIAKSSLQAQIEEAAAVNKVRAARGR